MPSSIVSKKRSMLAMGVLVVALKGASHLPVAESFVASSSSTVLPSLRPSNLSSSSTTSLKAKKRRNNAAATTSVLALPMVMAGAATTTTTTSGAAAAGGASSSLLTSSGSLLLNMAVDPVVEAEFLTDVSHVSLDLITLLGPATLTVRTAAVLGRLCAMAADYVPDHSMLPTELVFQTFMLGIACLGLAKAAWPLALSNWCCRHISLRDGKLYTSLFRPAGLTWEQFKALSVYALEWVTDLPAGTVIDSTEAAGSSFSSSSSSSSMYWLYQGQVRVTSQNRELYTASAGVSSSSSRGGANNNNNNSKQQNPQQSGDTAASLAFLWGESSLFAGAAATEAAAVPTAVATPASTTLQAGPGGATLVRLNVPKLHQLMDSDPALAESMRTLVFQGMQAKLLHIVTTTTSAKQGVGI